MFNTIEEAIADIKAGKMIIVADDENRENEGDLVMAADFCRPEDINFMITKARGLVCVPISCAQAQRLGLEPMVEHNTDAHCTAFTVSVDKLHGTTTGISAAERATTARALADPKSIGGDFRKPGHIFPLTARPGGVLQRAGHTEAAVDITRLAGLNPAGVICEIMNEDGTMARLPQLLEFAAREGLKIISVEELIRYRVMREKFVKKEVTVPMPTQWGDFVCHAYTSPYGDNPGAVHIALVKGDISGDEPVLVRVHSECFTGDLLGSLRCDCGPQLHAQGLRPPGQGTRHGRGQRRARLRARPARLRHRRADTRGPRPQKASADDQQPRQDNWAFRLRPRNNGAGADRDTAEPVQRKISKHEALPHGAYASRQSLLQTLRRRLQEIIKNYRRGKTSCALYRAI